MHKGMGLSPASARISALLILADLEELTFDQIRDALDLCKSATSNAINNRLMLKRISYKTKPGYLKRYFHNKLVELQNGFIASMQGLAIYYDVL